MLTDADKKLIGGSDIAAIAGLHPNKGPMDVWQRIIEGVEQPDSGPLKRGRLMEPVIREMYADETGFELEGPQRLGDPKRPWLRANVDDIARTPGARRVAEFKSVSIHVAHQYGDGGDDIPMQHVAQVQVYLHASGLQLADVAALIGVDELRVYNIRADAELQEMLLDAGARFWRDFVMSGRPPPPDSTKAYAEYLSRRFPKETLPAVAANAEAERWAKVLADAKAQLKLAESRKSEAEAVLKAFIGDASGMVGEGFRVSWKRNKDSLRTDFEAACLEAGVPEEILQKHTRAAPGPRVFRLTMKKEETVDG